MKKQEFKLLPHIRTDLYGLSTNSEQFYGWQIKKFNIEKYWKYSEGEGVTVAVIDTGCDLDHEDIKANIVNGYNFIDPGKDPQDDNGHGTHVAGTIAAINNGIGMVGLAPKTKIMPVKVLAGNGSGSNKSVSDGIVWAVDHGADILAMSLGSPSPGTQLEQAIQYAKRKNVSIFCAAGNSGIESGIQYPAKYSDTVSVGAIDENLNICQFSCCGEELDFLAPGYNIISSVPGNRYASMTGTSMANPFAVGCASLLLSYSRKEKFSNIDNRLESSDDYVKVFSKGTEKLGNHSKYAGIRKYEGYGIIKPVL
jgi:subtilisin family serine protease